MRIALDRIGEETPYSRFKSFPPFSFCLSPPFPLSLPFPRFLSPQTPLSDTTHHLCKLSVLTSLVFLSSLCPFPPKSYSPFYSLSLSLFSFLFYLIDHASKLGSANSNIEPQP